MDLTPRLLTEVEFREQWRGYSPNDVDDFLERVAAAVGELQERLREASERASQAERRLLDRSDDDEIRRTLVLAQRTAATAVEEARAEAERIIAEADRKAAAQVAEAERRLAGVEAELVERRATLQADIDVLSGFVEEHRARLRAELERQLAMLDTPNPGLDLAERPVVSDPGSPVEPLSMPEPFVPRPPTEEEVAQAREDLVEALRRAGVDDLLGGLADVAAAEAEPEPELELPPEPEARAEAPAVDGPRLYDVDDESGEFPLVEPTGAYDALVDDEGADEDIAWREPVVDVAAEEAEPIAEEHDDDPFLAELRRAVTDTEPLGPRDHDDVAAHHEHDDDLPSGRFRIRRGR